VSDLDALFRDYSERFRVYTRAYQRGELTLDAYRQAINSLRIVDTQGRTWMLQEGTGHWHVWQNGQWIPASPPISSPLPFVGDSNQPVRSQGSSDRLVRSSRLTDSGWGRFFGKFALTLLGVGAFCAVVAVALIIFVSDVNSGLLLGIGAAGAFSLFLTAISMAKQWEGEIIDLFTKVERVEDEDMVRYERRRMARVRQPSGKIRQVNAARNWEVGDYLVKRRGDMRIKRIPKGN